MRPSIHTKTGRVWSIADQLMTELGRPPVGKEVVQRYVLEGGNPSTGQVQFSAWNQQRKREGELVHRARTLAVNVSRKALGSGAAETWQLRVDDEGKILLPDEILVQLNLGENGELTAQIEGGQLRMSSQLSAIQQMQEFVRKNRKGTGSLVDELIAERHEAAARGD